MRYYHSDIYNSRNWLDTNEFPALDPITIITDYYHKHCYTNDADVCGGADVQFAFEMPNGIEYYSLTHEWVIEFEPEWNIYNSYEIKKLDSPTFNFPSNRDWIDLT